MLYRILVVRRILIPVATRRLRVVTLRLLPVVRVVILPAVVALHALPVAAIAEVAEADAEDDWYLTLKDSDYEKDNNNFSIGLVAYNRNECPDSV